MIQRIDDVDAEGYILAVCQAESAQRIQGSRKLHGAGQRVASQVAVCANAGRVTGFREGSRVERTVDIGRTADIIDADVAIGRAAERQLRRVDGDRGSAGHYQAGHHGPVPEKHALPPADQSAAARTYTAGVLQLQVQG